MVNRQLMNLNGREPFFGPPKSQATVQARLGHASASETLDTYSHLWPDNDDRTRVAVDQVLGNFADYLRTNGGDETHNRRSEA